MENQKANNGSECAVFNRMYGVLLRFWHTWTDKRENVTLCSEMRKWVAGLRFFIEITLKIKYILQIKCREHNKCFKSVSVGHVRRW